MSKLKFLYFSISTNSPNILQLSNNFLLKSCIPSSSIGLRSLSSSFSSVPAMMGAPFVNEKAMFTTESTPGGRKEILVQHLLVKENDLNLLSELQKRIAGGEDLSKLAAEYSICPSNAEGGNLGWVKRGQMEPEVEEAAFSGPLNTIVKCKTKCGWHLFQVLSEREELSLLQRVTCEEDQHKICTILTSSKEWSVMQESLEKCTIHYTPDLVIEILRICSHCGYAALHFFSWVRKQPGYKHTTDTYNMAIKIAGRGKDFKCMRSLFYEMQRNGCMVTSDTWTIMIMSYGRVGLTDIALRNFNEMKASGSKPSANTFKYLILSLCGRKGTNVDEAIKVFREMNKTGLIPDKELVEGFFDGLCQAGKLADARKCLEYLQKVGFSNILSYSLLIRALCRKGKVEEALALANNVKEDRSTLDHYIYGSLVHGLLQKGQIDEALAKIDSMKQAGIHPTVHVYTSLISYYCKEKQIDRALDIFKTMWEGGCHPTIVTYTALIRGYINTGNIAEAQKLFLRIRLKGPYPDFRAYSMLIAGLCEMSKSETALEFLSEMWDYGIVPSTVNFQTVFFGLNREGKHHLARTVMQQKRTIANKRKFLTL